VAVTQAAPARDSDRAARKLRGDFPTPPVLVDRVVAAVLPPIVPGQVVRVLDPACGDGRFLLAAAAHIHSGGGVPVVRGLDVDPAAVADASRNLADVRHDVRVADALVHDWTGAMFDVVLGNPPYLSQLASATSRGRASTRGGGPYADVAAEFLALAVELARPGGGRVGLVLPQSILGSRDARAVRQGVEGRAEMIWSWWSPDRLFDADVHVCALGFERRAGSGAAGNSPTHRDDRDAVWSGVIAQSLGVPALPAARSSGLAGDRATFTANFRDEYYGMIPGVGDHAAGPKLVTSGLIDPNRCRWGERPVTFNRQVFARPRIDVAVLSARMQHWARRMAVPKLLIANQTKVVECIVDRDGVMLPGVPVVASRPTSESPDALDALAAVLSCPYVSAWAWHRVAGTGLSASAVRVGPRLLAAVPWPAGPLGAAIAAWRAGDLAASGREVHAAFGIAGRASERLVSWWRALLPSSSPA
jgi:hypothetical protein